MITELFIEDNRVDLSKDLSALLTFAVDDIKDFGARHTNFSKTIVLPGTARNKKVFGHVFHPAASMHYDPSLPNVAANYNIAKSAEAMMFQGNIQVFKGIIRILEIIDYNDGTHEYEVQLVGEMGGLVYELGNKKLEDLSFASTIGNYDLTFSIANITASWNFIGGGDGIYWPLIDYGGYGYNSKKDWDYRTFRPALYVKDYVDKILNETNYTYESDLFETTRFKSLIVPFNQKALTKLDTVIGEFESTANQDLLSAPLKVKFQTSSGLFTPNVDFTEFTYTGPTAGIRIILNIQGQGDGVNYTIKFTNDPAVGAPVSNILFEGGSLSNFGFNLDYNDYFTGTITTNDVISINVLTEVIGFTPEFTVFSATMSIEVDTAIPVPLSLGDDIVINEIIPRGILQKDFFSSILKLFNLYVTEDKTTPRNLVITPYIDYYRLEPGTAVDWSLKLDRSKPTRITPMSELNARFYEFKFKADNDYYNDLYKKRYNETYGSRIYDSEYEFSNESNGLELIFAGTPLVGYSGEDKVYSTIFKKSGSTEEQTDSVIRILQPKKVTGVTSWNILDTDGTTVLSSQTAYGYAGHLNDPDAPEDDINFGIPKELFFTLASGALNVNQFNVYYSPYMAEITDKDSRLITATFRLTARDIMELDFSRLVYLDGILYRLNKIEDYNASNEDTCKVELLKVLYGIYSDYANSACSEFPLPLPATLC